jgi:hypothetical protein
MIVWFREKGARRKEGYTACLPLERGVSLFAFLPFLHTNIMHPFLVRKRLFMERNGSFVTEK